MWLYWVLPCQRALWTRHYQTSCWEVNISKYHVSVWLPSYRIKRAKKPIKKVFIVISPKGIAMISKETGVCCWFRVKLTLYNNCTVESRKSYSDFRGVLCGDGWVRLSPLSFFNLIFLLCDRKDKKIFSFISNNTDLNIITCYNFKVNLKSASNVAVDINDAFQISSGKVPHPVGHKHCHL